MIDVVGGTDDPFVQINYHKIRPFDHVFQLAY